MSRDISVSYDLNPPADMPSPSLDKSRTLAFPVEQNADLKAYYAGVREAIEKAKNAVGEELTVWRDAVGTREQVKESKTPKKDEDEEDEEGEEDGEE
jgi:hypothetical protein